MWLTHNSLATIIAWMSTCLLAGGASTLFNEHARVLWLIAGCFGLAAAVGLDIAARAREQTRTDVLELIATSRFERDMHYELEEHVANSAIHWAVAQLLGRTPPKHNGAVHHNRERHDCDLEVELVLRHGLVSNPGIYRCHARITNLNEFGFELAHSEQLPRQRMKLIIWSVKGKSQTFVGEVLWCNPQLDGTFLAGGRFLNVIANEDDSPVSPVATIAMPIEHRN